VSRWSLHLRLFAAGAAAVLAALTLAAIGLSLLFNAHVERSALAEMSIQLDQVLAGMDFDPAGKLTLTRPLSDPRFRRPLSGLYWQVDSADTTLRSRSLWDYTLPLPADETVNGMVHTHDVAGPSGETLLVLERQVRLPARLGSKPVRVSIAMDRAVLAAEGRSFVKDMVPYLALLAIFLIVAGWAQVAIGLRPLATVGARVAAVRSGESTRLGNDFPSEVRPLAGEVDALIDAREQDVVRARARAGDLAHGLKTPLQALYGEAARLRDAGNAEAAEAIEIIANAMHRHTDRELTRARIAARAPLATCDIATVVARVLSVVQRTPNGARVDWKVNTPVAMLARIDADDLTEALGAVVENAARHARGKVSITASRTPKTVVLTVTDDGDGIPEGQISALMGRGVRLDTAGSGTGLGLSIAVEIVEAVGGGLNLANAQPGVAVTFELPEV